MAAEEQQGEGVVVVGYRLVAGAGQRGGLGGYEVDGRGLLVPPGGLAPAPVDEPSGGHRDQPAARAVGYPLGRPLQRGREQRLLDRVLGGAEVAVPADQRGEGLRRDLAQQTLDLDPGGHISAPLMSSTGRTSTPPNRASGIFAASASARSRSLTSTM